MKSALAAGAAAVLAVTAAAAQSSTTTTQSKTTTTTTSTKWQSPDGMRGGSNSTTNTNTRSKSVTVGTPGPQRPNPHNSGWNNSQHPAGNPYAGGWRLAVGKSRPCMLTLYQSSNPQGGGATTSGCAARDLQAVGNWVLQGGHTLTLTKGLISTVATLNRTGPGRFQGTMASGEPITVWR